MVDDSGFHPAGLEPGLRAFFMDGTARRLRNLPRDDEGKIARSGKVQEDSLENYLQRYE